MADGTFGVVAVLLVVVAAFIVLGVVAYRGLGLSGEHAKRLAERRRALEESLARSLPATATIVSTQAKPREFRGGEFGLYRMITGTVEIDGTSHPIAWDVQLTAVAKMAPEASLEVLVDPADPSLVHPTKAWARSTVIVPTPA